jgi:trimethylguanosine synthase
VYGVEDHITFIQADYLEWAKQRAADPSAEAIDVVFLSPPWGGIDYREDQPHDPDASMSFSPGSSNSAAKGTYASYPLSRLEPVHGKEIFDISRNLTKNIAYFLPRNLDIAEAAALVHLAETIEVEEAWMGSKLKALTVYYGELALST